MVLEEDVNINVKVKGSEEVLNFVKGYNKQIKTTQSMSYEETKEKSRVFNNLKREASLLNNIYKARGENLKALVKYNAEQDRYEVQTEKVNTQNDRQKGKLDNLIKRYRWMQSFFLVTQNFVGMLGNSVKVFGAGVKMLLTPFILLLNLALIPALPYIKKIVDWVMGAVKAFKDWQDANELLADALGLGLFGAIGILIGCGLLAFIGTVIGGAGTFTGFLGIGASAEVATTAIGATATTGLAGALGILGGVIGGLALGVLIGRLMEAAGWFDIINDKATELRKNVEGDTPEAAVDYRKNLDLNNEATGGLAHGLMGWIGGLITGREIMTSGYLEKALSEGIVESGTKNLLSDMLGSENVITGSGNAQGYWYNGGNGAPQQLTSMSQVYNISMQSSATDLSGLQNDITTKQRLLSMEKGG